MEIELSLGKSSYLREIATAVLVLSLVGLGWLGSVVTRTGVDGSAQVLTWSDYQLGKLRRLTRLSTKRSGKMLIA